MENIIIADFYNLILQNGNKNNEKNCRNYKSQNLK